MSYIPIPKPSILDNFDFLGFRSTNKVWRSKDKKKYYTWDSLHGEIEVFNKTGYHLGSIDPITGLMRKKAVKGRKLDVK